MQSKSLFNLKIMENTEQESWKEIWCDCPKEKKDECFSGATYADDNMCRCGMDKHHYHGKICHKIVQIG